MSTKKLFLEKGGEMGSLTRAYPWTSTTIGSPETWSQSHLTSVNMMLTSRFPMLVFWGRDLITFYNDAFRPSLGNDGKHPGSLGQPGHQSWAESWPVIGPMIYNIMQGGEAVWFEDQKLPLYRDGKMGYAYWTYSFSPLLDDDGSVGGVLVTCSETTKAVESTAKLAESEQRFRMMVNHAPVAIFVLKGSDMIFELVNDLMYRMLGKGRDIIGLSYGSALPELVDQHFLDILENVYRTGETFYGNEIKAAVDIDGVPTDGYFNFVYQAIRNENQEVTGIVCVASNVVDQVNARKAIENVEQSMRLAIEAAELGTFSMNPETQSLNVSDRLKELFGFRPQEPVPYSAILDQIHPEYKQAVANMVANTLANGTPFKMEYKLTRHDNGNTAWVRGIGNLQYDANRRANFTGVIHDITEQKVDEQRKNDFIGMVSHELKTPITSLSGYLQLLSGNAAKRDDQFSGGMLEKATRQVRKMTTMINGFLNVSRLESGKIHIDKQPFDMADLVKEAETETLASVTTHQVVFAPVEPTSVLADRDKIGQVITNLISNAVKYSLPGSTINVACITVNDMAMVSVQDEGFGVAAEDLEKLFDRYYRVDHSGTKQIAGFGIGLYLCREIIERHQGTISVKSELGKGSTFYFTLPVEE